MVQILLDLVCLPQCIGEDGTKYAVLPNMRKFFESSDSSISTNMMSENKSVYALIDHNLVKPKLNRHTRLC